MGTNNRRLHHARLAALLLALLICANASAECMRGSRVLASVLRAEAAPNSETYFSRAGAFIDAGCYADALRELDAADAHLNREPLPKDSAETRRFAQAELRKYIDIRKQLEQGQSNLAKQRLFNLLAESRSTDVIWRATMTLGELLSKGTTPEEWARFSRYLDMLSSSSAWFWQVDYFRGLHDIRQGHGDAAIATVGKELNSELPRQHYLALQVVLLDLLVADMQYPAARIECVYQARDVGDELLDTQLRLRFLKACLAAWKQSSSHESTGQAARFIRVLESAIDRFKSAM